MTDDTPRPPDAPTPAPLISRRALWTMVSLGAVLVAAGIWGVSAVLPGYLTTPDQPAPATETTPPAQESRRIQATLFYVSEDGLELRPVPQDVPYGSTPAEQARYIVEAQVAAPTSNLASAIPAGTTVRAVFVGARGEAYVDLSIEATRNHSGGSHNEMLAVYAIVNAVTVNLPKVTGVQILIEGQEVDTLAGHVDLRQPFGREPRWVRRAQSRP